MNRRNQYKMLLVFILIAFVSVACQRNDNKTPKTVVVFVDVSASVKDYDVYRDSWKKILMKLNNGDRIVLGRITDETFTRFRPIVDETLPTFNMFKDNKLQFEKNTTEIKQKLEKALDEAFAASRSPKTDIFNTLVLAEKIFYNEKRRRLLVILSDMLEDSDQYNFERITIADDFIRHVITERREKGLSPDLRGTKVYVAGASARSADKALEVQRFWIEYCKAVNADLAPHNYGPTLINFDE